MNLRFGRRPQRFIAGHWRRGGDLRRCVRARDRRSDARHRPIQSHAGSHHHWRRRFMYSTLSAMSSRSFHMPAKGESPMERNLPEGVSTGTYTSTTVPSLIGTSWRGLKTPFSYFAGMVMVSSPVYSVTTPMFQALFSIVVTPMAPRSRPRSNWQPRPSRATTACGRCE